jgi:hypothetical protein
MILVATLAKEYLDLRSTQHHLRVGSDGLGIPLRQPKLLKGVKYNQSDKQGRLPPLLNMTTAIDPTLRTCKTQSSARTNRGNRTEEQTHDSARGQ